MKYCHGQGMACYMDVQSKCCCTIAVALLKFEASSAKLSHFSDICQVFWCNNVRVSLGAEGTRGVSSVGLFYCPLLSDIYKLKNVDCLFERN
jgi:hypothetical protein